MIADESVNKNLINKRRILNHITFITLLLLKNKMGFYETKHKTKDGR